MAVSDIVGTVVSGSFLETLRSQPRLVAITRPVQIPNGANTVRVPKADTSVTVRDYTAATAMVRERYIPTHVDVVITEQKYVDVYVDDTEEVQTLPALLNDVGGRGGNALADTIGDHLNTTLAAAIDNSQRTLGATADLSSGWTADARTLLVNTMNSCAATAKKAGFPQDRLVWAVPFEVEEQLINYLVIDKNSFGTGQFSDAAFASRSLPRVFGADVLADPDLAYDISADGTFVFAHLLINGRSLGYAQQLRNTRLVRPTDVFGTDFQALAMYGSKRMDDTFFRTVALTITT